MAEKGHGRITWEEAMDILEGRSLLCKVFEASRLVCVGSNTVCDVEGECVCQTSQKCYDVWSRATACANCISYRAVREQDQITKLEYNKGKVFLIIAVPVEKEGSHYSLELIKNVTDAMLVNDPAYGKTESVNNIFGYFNNLATRDLFTHFYNKPYLEQKMSVELREANKNHMSLTVALMNMDDFKTVNQECGHMVGDKALKLIASVIRAGVGDYDCWVARYSGDEFFLMFHNTPLEDVMKCCREIQKRIPEKTAQDKTLDRPLSVSIGVYEVNPDEDTYQTIIGKVEEQMHAAKQQLGKGGLSQA